MNSQFFQLRRRLIGEIEQGKMTRNNAINQLKSSLAASSPTSPPDGPGPGPRPDRNGLPRRVLTNWSNSCFLDSILTIMLLGNSTYYRDTLFDNTYFANLELTNKVPKSFLVCTPGNTVGDDDVAQFGRQLQMALQTEYKQLFDHEGSNSSLRCTNTRNLLFQCLPGMKSSRGRWVIFDARITYQMFADLFPIWKIPYLEAIYNLRDPEPRSWRIKTPAEPEAFFQMYDFVTENLDLYAKREIPYVSEENTAQRAILWDTINHPVLVFQNGGTPVILRWNEIGIETNPTFLYNTATGRRRCVKQAVMKVRRFDEYILDRRYRLFGVIHVHGTEMCSDDSGTHYTAYVRNGNDWFSYDDLGPRFERFQSGLPQHAFYDVNGRKPEFFFYERLS